MVFSLVSYKEVSAVTANAGDHFYVANTTTGASAGDGWSYSDNTITISQDGDYTIEKACDCTGAHYGYQIYVAANVAATITINNVQITNIIATMYIDDSANVTLILEGDNSFITSGYARSGIHLSNTSTLIITSYSDGSLTAQAGDMASGIGGSEYGSGYSITILGGTVTATEGMGSAKAIGGSKYYFASKLPSPAEASKVPFPLLLHQ